MSAKDEFRAFLYGVRRGDYEAIKQLYIAFARQGKDENEIANIYLRIAEATQAQIHGLVDEFVSRTKKS